MYVCIHVYVGLRVSALSHAESSFRQLGGSELDTFGNIVKDQSSHLVYLNNVH